jgi:hypothetical protein
MPSAQRGQVRKLANGSWAYRLRDDAGRRPQVGGFPTKGAASAALSDAIDAVRDGKLGIRRQLTFSDLVDEYLDQHIAEENTIATLRARLKHVTKAFGSRPLDRLMVNEIALGGSGCRRGRRGTSQRRSGRSCTTPSVPA